MAITTPHPLVTQYRGLWRRVRDAFEGEDAVKAAGPLYLPPLDGQRAGDAAYERYKQRAAYYPAVDRTVAGLAGLIFRKPVTHTAPPSIAAHLRDVSLRAEPLDAFALAVVRDLLVTSRAGIVVDWGGAERGRPYWTLYPSEAIVNWTERVVDGRRELTRLVLAETYYAPGDPDPDALVPRTRYREYVLEAEAVVARVWERVPTASGREDYVVVETPPLVRRGRPLRFIPFACATASGMGIAPGKPVLLDMVNVNLAHYRNAADYEHGLHYVAVPTPYITGYGLPPSTMLPRDLQGPESGASETLAGTGAPQPALYIGASAAWQIPNEKASVGMLEFSGAGLGALRTAMQDKEAQMAALGARLLQPPSSAETAEAARIRHGSTTSALQLVADAASALLTRALRMHGWWVAGDDAVLSDHSPLSVMVNRDFFDARLTPQELAELTKLWQAGGISYSTLYWNMQQGEVARPGVSMEEERAAIEAEEPSWAPGTDGAGAPEVPEGDDEDERG